MDMRSETWKYEVCIGRLPNDIYGRNIQLYAIFSGSIEIRWDGGGTEAAGEQKFL
jgi:hypothetical protein